MQTTALQTLPPKTVKISPIAPEDLRTGNDLMAQLVGDPAALGFPPFLPVELALAESPPRDVCTAYGITRDHFVRLLQNPAFTTAYVRAKDMLKREGMSFRVKAIMQAEALLSTSWKLIHHQSTPPAVKADLIKHTWKVAGLEPKDTAAAAAVVPLQINIQL